MRTETTVDEQGACILTNAEGENPDDCTTHEHEPPPTRAAERPTWEFHEGEDYIVILGDNHDTTDNPIARVYEVAYAEQIVSEHNNHATLLRQKRELVEALRQTLSFIESQDEVAKAVVEAAVVSRARAALNAVVCEGEGEK